jgi:hypothetical protein
MAFRMACDLSEDHGCVAYARLWKVPEAGVPLGDARSLLTDACFDGDRDACTEGARAYGNGSTAESAAAVGLLENACDLRDQSNNVEGRGAFVYDWQPSPQQHENPIQREH